LPTNEAPSIIGGDTTVCSNEEHETRMKPSDTTTVRQSKPMAARCKFMRCCGAAYLSKILQQGKNVFFLLHILRSRITAKISAITSAFGLTPAQNKKAVAKDFLICLRDSRAVRFFAMHELPKTDLVGSCVTGGWSATPKTPKPVPPPGFLSR
jgi:hypothetical protein